MINHIDILGLSERTRNVLIKNGILYIESLTRIKEKELISLRGIGKYAIKEINLKLSEIGESLA